MGTTVFERRPPQARVVDHALEGTAFATFWLDDIARAEHPRLTDTIRTPSPARRCVAELAARSEPDTT